MRDHTSNTRPHSHRSRQPANPTVSSLNSNNRTTHRSKLTPPVNIFNTFPFPAWQIRKAKRISKTQTPTD